jgi:hypothetical protein
MGADEFLDTVPPGFLAASLSPRKFRVDPKGPAETPVVAAKKKKKKKAPRGTTFTYRLSEDARVVFTIQRIRKGRRVHKKCVKPTKKNRKKKACKRFKRAGRFAQQASAGVNTKRFSGRIGKKKLRPGRYRATLVATDGQGNASKPKRLKFRVVK